MPTPEGGGSFSFGRRDGGLLFIGQSVFRGEGIKENRRAKSYDAAIKCDYRKPLPVHDASGRKKRNL